MAKKVLKQEEEASLELTNPFIERQLEHLSRKIKTWRLVTTSIKRSSKFELDFHAVDKTTGEYCDFSVNYNEEKKSLKVNLAIEAFEIHSTLHSLYYETMQMLTDAIIVSSIRESIEEILKRD